MGEFTLGLAIGSLVTSLAWMVTPLFKIMADNARERRLNAEANLRVKEYDAAMALMKAGRVQRNVWHV